MSEEINNEDVLEQPDVLPAKLQDGEPVISKEKAEQFKTVIEEIKNSAKVSLDESLAEEAEDLEELEDEVLEDVKEEAPKNVISSGSQKTGKSESAVAGITAVANGVIGTGTVAPKKKNVVKQKPAPEVEKVALYSSKNVTWNGVGKVYRGYNIVTKEAADKWLTRDHTRVATPEEVAEEFNQ